MQSNGIIFGIKNAEDARREERQKGELAVDKNRLLNENRGSPSLARRKSQFVATTNNSFPERITSSTGVDGMRFSDQLGSLVKNVSTELTLEEHRLLRNHVEKTAEPVNTFLRKIVLQAIAPATTKQSKQKAT